MKAISKAIQNWVMQERDRAYLSGIPHMGEEDLGMTRDEALALIDGRADTRERLLAMAGTFGLSAEDIDRDRQASLDISLTCGKCKSSRICARFLAGHSYAGPESFCPNSAKYAEMADAA